MGLVFDEPIAAQNAPDRRQRGHAIELTLEVTGDRVRACVVAFAGELQAQPNDRRRIQSGAGRGELKKLIRRT